MKIRKLVRETLLRQILLEASRKDIENKYKHELYDQFAPRFDAAVKNKSLEEFDAVEQEYLAAVNQAVEQEMIRQGGSTRASQTKTKIEDKPKWSDLDDLQNTQLAPIDNQSLETFYDDGSQDVIDVTDGDNPQFMMNRRDFLKNSALGTAAAAYGLKKGFELTTIDPEFKRALQDAMDTRIDIDMCSVITYNDLEKVGSHVDRIVSSLETITPNELAQIISAIFVNVIDDKMSISGTSKDMAREVDRKVDFDVLGYYETFYKNIPEFAGVTMTESWFGKFYGGYGSIAFAPVGSEYLFNQEEFNNEEEEGWELYEQVMESRDYFNTRFAIDPTSTNILQELIADRFTGLNWDSISENSKIDSTYNHGDSYSIEDYEEDADVVIIQSPYHAGINDNIMNVYPVNDIKDIQ